MKMPVSAPTTNPVPHRDVGGKIVAMVFIGVGVLIVIGSLLLCVGRWQFVRTAASASGIVTKLNAGGSHPDVQFTTDQGKTIRYPQGGMIWGYNPGDKVTVLYDRANPNSAILNTWNALWGFEVGGILIGLLFIGMAILKLKRPDLVH